MQWAAQTVGDLRSALQAIRNGVLSSAESLDARLGRVLAQAGWYQDLIDEAVQFLATSGQLEVQVQGNLPATAVTIPAPLRDRIVYRAGDGKLIGSLTLNAGEWTALKTANNARPELTNAIIELQGKVTTFLQGSVTPFAAPLPDHLHRMQSFDLPVHAVAYDPTTRPSIPRELKARCYFDPSFKQLAFRGWMTDPQKKQLLDTLPSADAGIVDQLKTASDNYKEQVIPNRFLFDIDEVKTLFSATETVQTRVEAVLGKLLSYLYRKEVIARLGSALNLDSAVIANVLADHLDHVLTLDALVDPGFVGSDNRVAITLDAFQNQFRAVCKLHKVALVCRAVRMKPAEVKWLPPVTAPLIAFQALNLDLLPPKSTAATALYDDWRQLVLLFRLRDDKRFGDGLLAKLLFYLNADDLGRSLTVKQQDIAAQQAYLAQGLDCPIEDVIWAAKEQLNLQWPADYQQPNQLSKLAPLLSYALIARVLRILPRDVTDSVAHLNLSWPADFGNPETLTDLLALLATIQRLGAKATETFSLTQDAAAAAGKEAIPGKTEATLARYILRARYDEQSWPGQLKPIVDVLREKQRAALVSYLIAHPPEGAVNNGLWKDSNDVYEHYLIDPEMGPCRMSTRILHAISAVQLFVQRCLMNLEKDLVSPADIDAERWEWTKNYRVWEANRKVFLYPENWIEPELRDDKSEIFTALEGQLQQSEFDRERAVDILKDYLKQLEDISNVAVVGMYIERILDEKTQKLVETDIHIVGRTRNKPSRFFYRRWILTDANSWTPWEHLPIDGVKTDHILPFVMGGDVYIAWPEFTQLASAPGATDGNSPGTNWRLQMTWIRRTSRGWSDRLMCGDTLEHPWLPGKDENETFTFRVRTPQPPSPPADGIPSPIMVDCLAAPEDSEFIFGISTEEQPEALLDFRDMIVDPENNFMNVTFYGTVFNSYQMHGEKVNEYASGITVYFDLLFDDANAMHDSGFNDDWYWRGRDRVTHPLNPPQPVIDFDNDATTHDIRKYLHAETTTGPNGAFTVSLSLASFAMYDHDVLSAKPKLVLVVDPDASAITVKKDFSEAVGNSIWLKVNFTQKFEIKQQGIPPGAEPERPVSMQRIAQFVLYDAEDAEIQTGDNSSWSPPAQTTADGSGYYAIYPPVPFNPFVPKDDDLLLPDGTITIWNHVADKYRLIPAFPTDPHIVSSPDGTPALSYSAPELFVYRDDKNSYFIRAEDSGSTRFQVIVDGHPRAGMLRMTLSQQGVPKLFALPQQVWTSQTVFGGHNPYSVVDPHTSLMTPSMCFEPDDGISPSASYNTELFFHVPFVIATFLTGNQRFEDAQQWFHYIFDPTSDEYIQGNERYWKYLPFRNHAATTPIDELLKRLADPAVPSTDKDKQQFATQLDVWLKNPFRPHAVARLRPRAYEFSVVFKYLDNLIAWGDSLFRQYTTESINEATLHYILAQKLLGPRPQTIPHKTDPAPLTYRKMAGAWDKFSNVWLELEANVPPPTGALQKILNRANLEESRTTAITSVGMLYFCVPANDKMLDYWDKVENRLFNIRHCRNIDGVVQEVPLFQPPIDPALLVKAVAAGLDISTVLSEVNAPLPYYRFNVMAQKASELCNEVKALGSALLSALEKKDAEDLAVLRSSQELTLLNLVQSVKEKQIDEANANIDALKQSEQLAITRFMQYQRLLGNSGAKVPDDAGADIEQSSMVRVTRSDASGDLSGLGLSQAEQDSIGWSEAALKYAVAAGVLNIVSGIGYAIPNTQAGTPFLSSHFGGINIGSILSAGAAFCNTLERNATYQATRSSTIGQHQRRQDDWVFQSRLALQEIQQIRKQRIVAEIRRDIATNELENHKTQIKNAEATDRFMHEKYTNRDLYQWMTQQISGVYFKAYQLAYDVANRAERAFRCELGLSGSNYVQFGYWDSLKKGLLAGEKLSLDLKRMELAYFDQNKREYEITKHISLLALDPFALISLKENHTCTFDVPEALFDLDFPGHYMRRIKMVSLSIPCVAGTYASVSATLQLTKSKTRVDPSGDTYNLPEGDPDPRITSTSAAIMAIVTSSAQQDSGMFEPNLRDERYLPFEGAGAVSTWQLSLPDKFRPFDYETISDVVLHIRYTARDGGNDLKTACQAHLQDALKTLTSQEDAANDLGLARLFSLRHEFPTEWHRFLNPPTQDSGNQSLTLTLGMERFPFLFRDTTITITAIQVFVLAKSGDLASTLNMSLTPLKGTDPPSAQFTFTGNTFLTGKETQADNAVSPLSSWILNRTSPGNELQITAWLAGITHGRLDSRAIHDIVLVCRYTCSD